MLMFKEYERDLFAEDTKSRDHSDPGKRNLVDLAEFIGHFSGRLSKSEGELMETYPELFNKHFDRDRSSRCTIASHRGVPGVGDVPKCEVGASMKISHGQLELLRADPAGLWLGKVQRALIDRPCFECGNMP